MRILSAFSVTFFTRKSRSNPNELSIYTRINVKGKRAEISLKRCVNLAQWDSTRNRGRGNTEKIRALNAYLDQVCGKLLQCHKQLLEEDKIISSDAIKIRYLGEDDTSKTNTYLKEIAKSCGIHKNISFHVARHTFATTVMLSNGVPIETVSKLLGHTKLSTTQLYARVVESKISEDIGNLLERFKEKENIVRGIAEP